MDTIPNHPWTNGGNPDWRAANNEHSSRVGFALKLCA